MEMAKFKGSVLVCLECGKEFRVSPVRSKTAKYCSKECADVHRHDTTTGEKVECKCQRCGKTFYDHPCHSGRRKYCSYECAKLSAVKEETRVCAYCGDPFVVNPSSSNICCSWECRVARSNSEDWPTRNRILRQCVQCGKEFWKCPSAIKRWNGGGKFCCRKCKIDSQKLDVTSPASFYATGPWLQARKRIVARDNHTCQKCGFNGKRLHVHHVEFKRNGGTETDDNLVTLCPHCHRIEHQND
ncbi:HNH endonuclease [bacterium]|nr:MAG: HNH endonuclease [bacterium]